MGEFLEHPVMAETELLQGFPPSRQELEQFNVEEDEPIVESAKYTENENNDDGSPSRDWIFKYLFGNLGNI